MKKKPLIILLIVAILSGGAYWWQVKRNDQANDTSLTLYGNVDHREVRLAFNGSEHVSEILVDEGDKVKAGQLLARLHTERLQAAYDRAQAELNATKAEAQVAQLTYQRVKSLLDRKLTSPEAVDEAKGKSRAATARVAAAEAVLQEHAQVLKDAQLYAPVSGVVRERIVEVGDFVNPQTPVITLALMNPVWVRTYLPDTYLGHNKPGAIVTISTDSYPDKVYKGWIGSISPTAEFTPKNIETPELRTRLVYQVRVFACNPQFELRLGMPATVHIALDQKMTAEVKPDERCSQPGEEQQ
ncbi:MAG: efflux RND transporter periplasmic adaptor subunit [Gammaproteobacteria bacterium]